MRRIARERSLHALLGLNAVTMAALLWTQLAGTPGFVRTADAQVVVSPGSIGRQSAPGRPGMPAQTDDPNAGGIPNAGLQRLSMINELKAIRADLNRLETHLASGKLQVSVTNFDDIRFDKLKLDLDYAKLKAAMAE